MKKLIAAALLAITVSAVQAQIVGKVTKLTVPTSATGVVIVEDTTGSGSYLPRTRSEVYGVVSGTATADARWTLRSKTTDNVLATFLLNTVRVVGAASQSLANKITYLKANSN